MKNLRRMMVIAPALLLSALGIASQVRIGGTDPVSAGVIMDLNPAAADSVTSNKGLALTRVTLSSSTDTSGGMLSTVGNVVFNVGNGDGTVYPGVWYSSGSKWYPLYTK